MDLSSTHLNPYVTKYKWHQMLTFWVRFAIETASGPCLSRLMHNKPGRQQIDVAGFDNLPGEGVFVLAVNHFSGGMSLGVIAALLETVNIRRPDLRDKYMLVVGKNVHSNKRGDTKLFKVVQGIARWLYQRWAGSVIHIPTGNCQPSIASLRKWRLMAQHQPIIVFPEGKTSLRFGDIRKGASRWLSSFQIPTVPVGVWWYENRWCIRFGKQLEWSRRSDLRDIQLGLSIAVLLPADLACTWQHDLKRWRQAHASGDSLRAG